MTINVFNAPISSSVFAEALNVAAPNATVPVVSMTGTNAAANVDVALAPKGSGGVAANIADNLVPGGNKRGTNAVDWQSTRTVNTQVASGVVSVIGGGVSNTASGTYAFVGGGTTNAAGGNASVIAGGSGNTANGTQAAIGGGLNNISSSSWSTVAGGIANSATAINSTVGGGNTNFASGSYSTIPGGYRANTQSIFGKYAYASGFFTIEGDAQLGVLTLRRATTDATATVLTSDQTAPTAVNQLVLQNNQGMAVRGQVICRRSVAQADQISVWEFTGAIRRGANAAATALVAAVTPTLIAQDSALLTAAFTVTADTTNGSLLVTVTGIAALNLRWFCTLTTSEIIYA